MPRRRKMAALGVWGLAAFFAVDCQWITGASERTFEERPPCSKTSECATGAVCFLGLCSRPCTGEKICPMGTRCLRSDTSSGCVDAEQASCGPTQSCPMGTTCSSGECRAVCNTASVPCLDGQACLGSVCIGNDPSHDPAAAIDASTSALDAANTSAGGSAGTSGGSGGNSVEAGILADSSSGGGAGVGGSRIDSGPPDAPVDPCKNGKKDGTETDIDCGGNACPKCDDGLRCKIDGDCEVAPCGTGGLCGPPAWILQNACYILLVRNGVVVESESSPESVDCDLNLPAPRPRATDRILVYARNPPNHAVDAYVDHPPAYWYSRCAGALTTRAQLLAELNNSMAWEMSPEVDFAFPYFTMSRACPTAAVYRF